MYSEGYSDVEVCKELKLPWKEFEKRLANDTLFAELVDFGRLASKAWWLRLGRKCATSGAPSQAFGFWDKNMKNRFGWADRTEEVSGKKAVDQSTDEIQDRIRKIKEKINSKPASVELTHMVKDA